MKENFTCTVEDRERVVYHSIAVLLYEYIENNADIAQTGTVSYLICLVSNSKFKKCVKDVTEDFLVGNYLYINISIVQNMSISCTGGKETLAILPYPLCTLNTLLIIATVTTLNSIMPCTFIMSGLLTRSLSSYCQH